MPSRWKTIADFGRSELAENPETSGVRPSIAQTAHLTDPVRSLGAARSSPSACVGFGNAIAIPVCRLNPEPRCGVRCLTPSCVGRSFRITTDDECR